MTARRPMPAAASAPNWRDLVLRWSKPNRVMAPVRWYGGKGMMAHHVVPYLPRARVYVEPYCGAASVFWRLPRPYPCEVLNDLNGDLIGLFRALQDPERFERLAHRLTFTPWSRAEFARALDVLADEGSLPDDRAWAFMVAHGQGFSGTARTVGNWGRVFVSSRGMAAVAAKWRSGLRLLADWHDRLMRVQIDNRDAMEAIRYWDSAETVFYLDPPYVAETRAKNHRRVYRHEADDEHHRALVAMLLGLKGVAVLSGYDSPLYAPLGEAGWQIKRIETACHAAIKGRGVNQRHEDGRVRAPRRMECLWISPAAQKAKTLLSQT